MESRRSRCTVPRAAPLEWRNFIDPADSEVAAFAAWLAGLQAPFRQRVVGRLDALLEQAAEGGLPFDPAAADDPGAPLVPVRRDPDLYELRITLLNKKVRQYHAEPPGEPDLLVSLQLHIKTDQAGQDAAISVARVRYRAGERSDWRR